MIKIMITIINIIMKNCDKLLPHKHKKSPLFRGLPGDDKSVFVIVLTCLPVGGFRLTLPTKHSNINQLRGYL